MDYIGSNEKTKIVAKLQKKGQGPPSREPVFTEDDKKKMMAYAYKKQEEVKVLYIHTCTRYNDVQGSVRTYMYVCILVQSIY